LLVWRKLRTRAAAGRVEAQQDVGRSGDADAAGPAWLDRAAYPFRHRYVDLPSGRVHFVDEGLGEPVLFVHGTPTWSFEFRHLIRALAPRYRCVAPDLLGFGLSSRPPAFPYTPEAHATVLADFVETLRLDRVTLVVHDYGGPIGLPLCLDHPERFSRLVLLNTWMWPLDDDPDVKWKARLASGRVGRFLYQYANASLRLIVPMAYGDRAKLTRAVHRQYLEPFRRRGDRALVLHALARAILGSRDFYAGLWGRAERLKGHPALIIWGMKDPAFGPRHLARWESLLPEARVVRLARAGHWPHEEEPARVVEALESFLRH